MPKRTSKPRDVNQAAFEMVRRSTSEEPVSEVIIVTDPKPSKYDISRVMAEMGRKGGQIGGKRRMETMTEAARKKVAKKAANARWKKAKRSSGPNTPL
jgi:hypothetical protein